VLPLTVPSRVAEDDCGSHPPTMLKAPIPDEAIARAAAFVVEKAKTPRKVMVALSGGVDSSVAAWLLQEAGHLVIGVSLRLAPDAPGAAPESGRCCSVDDLTDARRVAHRLSIPFHALDARERFKAAVFDPFVRDHARGRTPIPCLACNHDVKVGDLMRTARSLGAALATGHYARRVERGGALALARPSDRARDQTYYLYGTPFDDVADLELPLGDLDKPLIRALAQKAGLPVAHKPDSQEICFVPDGDHARVVEEAGGAGRVGALVHIGGKRLRDHTGTHRFTVGQRRGVGVSASEAGLKEGEKLFVIDVDGESGQVTVGPREALLASALVARPLRLSQPLSTWPEIVLAQVRARQQPQPARFAVLDDGSLSLRFLEPVPGVALGQAAVCYDGDVLLGGGIIEARLDGAMPRGEASVSAPGPASSTL
jgi:tRNA-specific 2-thiouridylase